ncbi:TRAP transporter small permease [Martelella sp. FLE1502]
MEIAARVVDLVDRLLRAVAALCLFALTCLVVFQVVSRYGWGRVPLFAEESARYAMIWMAMLAAAVGVRDGSHIRIEFVPDGLGVISKAARRVLEAVLDVISLTIFLVLMWYGYDSMLFAAGQASDGMRIPLSYPYSVVPIAFFIAAVFAVLRIVAGVRSA